MGSKKHHRRDSSSSSSDDSDSSGDSRKKHSRKHYSDENGENHSKSSKAKHRESGRTRRNASEERKYSKYKRSRSRSGDRKVSHREKSRSRSREPRDRPREHGRDTDKESHSGTSRSADRKDFKDRGYDYNNSRHYNNDRRKDFRRNNNMNRRNRSRSKSFDHANAKWGKGDDQSKDKKKDAENKAKPDFALSGKLAEQTNTYKGVVIKYSEPPEARKPRRRWRLYPFKGDKALQTLYIHRESAYLIGRDRKVVDLPVDHPSCSKQHAALQYRLVPFTRENGSVGKRVRPYLIDLDSANGTFINNKKIEPRKYVELLERDVIKFGFSSREYVLLHENSKDEALDDDVKLEDEEIKEEVDIKEEQD